MGFANGCIVSDGSVIIRLQFLPWSVWRLSLSLWVGTAGSLHPSFGRCHRLFEMLSFGPFVLLYVWLVAVLGMTILRAAIPFNVRKIPFLLNHAGLFVALLTATLGNADMQRLKMITQLARPNGVP